MNKPALSGYKGFTEDNGFISIHASHFTRQTNTASLKWEIVNDLGYTGNALDAFPISIKPTLSAESNSIKMNIAVV